MTVHKYLHGVESKTLNWRMDVKDKNPKLDIMQVS